MKKLKTSRISFQLDGEFKQQLIEYCERKDITFSELIRRLLREEMERNPISGGKEDETSR